jgi:hypothetical protein
MDSEIGRAKFGKVFTYMNKLAPQLATLVIATDSVIYDDANWSVFRELPRSVKNLYLEFDSCGHHDDHHELISDDVLDTVICEHIPLDVSCPVVRKDNNMKTKLFLTTGLLSRALQIWPSQMASCGYTQRLFLRGEGFVDINYNHHTSLMSMLRICKWCTSKLHGSVAAGLHVSSRGPAPAGQCWCE